MTSAEDLPQRVLVVMPAQWDRALLRAALREIGYDAIGARDLVEAERTPASEPGRGPLRMLIVDQRAFFGATGDVHFESFLKRVGQPLALLLTGATDTPPVGLWQRVLRRPMSISDITSAVEDLLPLPAGARHSLD